MNTFTENEFTDYKAFFQNIGDLVCIIGTDGHFRTLNPALYNLLGWTENELKSVPFTDFIHPEDFQKTADAVSTLVEGKMLELITNRYRKKSGEYLYINWQGNINPITKEIIGIGRNVTEKVKKEQELELLSKVLSKTKDVAVITNPEGNILWVNAAFEKLTEYSKEEVIGRRPGSFLQGEDTNQEDVTKIRDAVKNVQEIDVNLLNYSKTGKQYWLNINISPIYNSNNELEFFLAIERDVTEKIQSERINLKQQEEILKTKLELEKISTLSKVGGWEVDIINNKINWSAVTKEIHEVEIDYCPTLETGINFYKEGQSRDTISKVVANAIENGIPYDVELEIVTAKNNVKWVRAIGNAEYKDGICVALVGTFQDITIDVLLKEEREIENKRLAFTLEATGDGIWDWNPQTQKTYYSPRWLQILGFEVGDFTDSDQEWSSRIHPDDVAFTFKLIGKNLKGETDGFEHEYRFQNKKGKYIWIKNKGKVVDRNEAVITCKV